jgi:hypothetical protein
MEKSPIKLKILYFIMYRLMDLESIMWDIADFIIKPVALLRRGVANIINNNLKSNGKGNEESNTI